MEKQNVLENAAKILYGNKSKKEDEEKNLRNSLLKELNGSLEPKHILYSSIDELKKMKEEKNKTNFKGKLTGAAESVDSSNLDDNQAPLPISATKQTHSRFMDNMDEKSDDLKHEAKLLDKISVKREDDKIQNLNFEKEQDFEMAPLKAHIDYDEDINEIEVSNKQEDKRQFIIDNEKLTDKLKSKVVQSKILQNATEKMIGGNYNKVKHTLSRLSGADVQGTLDLAHGEENMHNPSYLKNTVKLKNFDDPAINKYKKTIKEKVQEQFKDYGYDENSINDIKGYYFKDNSDFSRRIKKNRDFKDIIKSNKQNILSNKNFSVSFPKHGPVGLMSDNNLKNSIGKADVLDYYIDKQSNLCLKILDTYDFNKDAKDFLNKAGRSQMLKGNLKPYFTIHEVKISKDELDEIWNN